MLDEQVLDLTGLQCPMPLLKTKLKLSELSDGDRLCVIASDPGSARDIPSYLALTPHELLEQFEDDKGQHHFHIVRRSGK